MARGGLGAILCPVMGAGTTGHVAVPELPRALVAGVGATRHVAVRGDESRGTRGHVLLFCLSSLT
jgi:hypothetical protein